MELTRDSLGQRVVVRRVVPDEVGPSGGPALTDVLGVLEACDNDTLSVRRDNGRVISIPRVAVVAASRVPPRASVRRRVPAADLQRICSHGWQPTEHATLGDWWLRAAGGFTGRANSVLMAGEPGVPTDEALDHVRRWYVDRDLPVLAQVVTDSPWLNELSGRGWVTARPDEGDTLVQVASVSSARRLSAARRSSEAASAGQLPTAVTRWEPVLDLVPDEDWMRLYGRAAGVREETLRAVLTSGERVAFASIQAPPDAGAPDRGGAAGAPHRPRAGNTVAIGRGVLTGDWLGLAAVEVEPAYQRRGLATVIVDELLEWGASEGALSAYLQALPHNAAAFKLYEPYGFRTHSSYRYLRPPDS